jgi:fatty-acyl-CoA synthase
MEWSIPAVLNVVSETVPHREILVWKDVRRSFGELDVRTKGLASFLVEEGIGIHRVRVDLERWECGQSPVALLLHNCPEYIESMVGCYRARAAPFNVNQQYKSAEVRSVLEMVGAEYVIYHRSLGELVRESINPGIRMAVEVDDHAGGSSVAGSIRFDDAVKCMPDALPVASPDDLYLVCTGGTTGMPKAVLWRQADIYVSAMDGQSEIMADQVAETALAASGIWFAPSPLMHAAAQWTVFAGLLGGRTVVMHDDRKNFDVGAIMRTAAEERVTLMSIVGDAFAHPIVKFLRENHLDLSTLRVIGTGGAATTDEVKQALLDLLPQVVIRDGYGASETGGMAYGSSNRTVLAKGFSPTSGAVVVSEDKSRLLQPGDDEIGWTAQQGRVPLGYLGNQLRTEATFPIVGESEPQFRAIEERSS